MNRKNRRNRILSLLVTLCMLATMVPAAVFADANNEPNPDYSGKTIVLYIV